MAEGWTSARELAAELAAELGLPPIPAAPPRRVQVRRKGPQFRQGQVVVIRSGDGHRLAAQVTATGNGLVWCKLAGAIRSIPIPAGEVEPIR
jgi:hypothetical protein